MTGIVRQAAAEIVALINSKPTSPSEAEIAAILGRIGANAPEMPMSPAHAEHHREWRSLIEAHLREFGEDCETCMTPAEVEAMERAWKATQGSSIPLRGASTPSRHEPGAMSCSMPRSASGTSGQARTSMARTRST